MMCLAIPGKVLSIEGDFAKVDFGLGVIRQAIISLVDVKVGEYVLIHAGYAIQVMDEREAEQTLTEWKALLEAEHAESGAKA